MFNAYGDIRYTSFGAVAASPIDLFKCSQVFHVSGGIMYTVLGASAAMSIDHSGRAAAGTSPRGAASGCGCCGQRTRHRFGAAGRADDDTRLNFAAAATIAIDDPVAPTG